MPLLDPAEVADLRLLVEDNLDYTCTIRRISNGGTDAYGQPLPPVYTVWKQNVPCFLLPEHARSTGTQQTTDRTVVTTIPAIWLKLGEDVAINDVITDITNQAGTAIQSGKQFQILELLPKRTKLQCTLRDFSDH